MVDVLSDSVYMHGWQIADTWEIDRPHSNQEPIVYQPCLPTVTSRVRKVKGQANNDPYKLGIVNYFFVSTVDLSTHPNSAPVIDENE